MIDCCIDIVKQIYFQPLFHLHLGIFWIVCLYCLVKDLIIFNNNTEKYEKYTIKDNPVNWSLYLHACSRTIYVQFCLLAPLMWIIYPFYSRNLSSEISYHYSVLLLIYCALIEEVLFFYIHKALHHPLLWKYHRLHHKLVTPVAMATFYASTVENIIANILPVLLSPLFIRLPIDLLWYWTIISTFAAVSSHCGFKMFESLAKFHAIHHLQKCKNFGVLGIMDKIHGTYQVEN